MGDIVFFIVQLFQGHYFSPLFWVCTARILRPMIFCDRGAGKSAFLATDIRRQVFILCGSPLYGAMLKTTFFRYLCTF